MGCMPPPAHWTVQKPRQSKDAQSVRVLQVSPIAPLPCG
jgi:hypothetical protein